MNTEELEVGMKVRVYDWSGDGDFRPGHWDEDMDEFMGGVVTIAHLKGAEVWLEDDDGEWCWEANDFDPYCSLPKDNPNARFKDKKSADHFERFKAQKLYEKEMATTAKVRDRILGRGL